MEKTEREKKGGHLLDTFDENFTSDIKRRHFELKEKIQIWYQLEATKQ